MSYGSFSSLILSSDYSDYSYTRYNTFFQKRNGLSNGRVALMKKSENGSKAKFLYSLLKVLRSISGELLIGIC